MRELYNEIAKTGTTEVVEVETKNKKKYCNNCKMRNHTTEECNSSSKPTTDGKRRCYLCGSEDHLSPDCPRKGGAVNKVNGKLKKGVKVRKERVKQDIHSNYLRTSD